MGPRDLAISADYHAHFVRFFGHKSGVIVGSFDPHDDPTFVPKKSDKVCMVIGRNGQITSLHANRTTPP